MFTGANGGRDATGPFGPLRPRHAPAASPHRPGMSLHAFDPAGPAPVGPDSGAPNVRPTAHPTDRAGPRAFAVRLRFVTPAARAAGFEVLTAEARIGGPTAAGRLGRIVEEDACDLRVQVEGAADPDGALGVVGEVLGETLLAFRVISVVPPDRAAPPAD